MIEVDIGGEITVVDSNDELKDLLLRVRKRNLGFLTILGSKWVFLQVALDENECFYVQIKNGRHEADQYLCCDSLEDVFHRVVHFIDDHNLKIENKEDFRSISLLVYFLKRNKWRIIFGIWVVQLVLAVIVIIKDLEFAESIAAILVWAVASLAFSATVYCAAEDKFYGAHYNVSFKEGSLQYYANLFLALLVIFGVYLFGFLLIN